MREKKTLFCSVALRIMKNLLTGLLLCVLTVKIAFAQCTKDTDCKGERICEGRVCMYPPTQGPATAGAAALRVLPTSPAATERALGPIGPALEELFRCQRNPEPSTIFSLLKATGYIENQPRVVVDGAPVFVVRKPLNIFGFRTIEVSGFDPNAVKPNARMPGTLSPLFFSATVEGDFVLVQAEAFKRFGHASTVASSPSSTPTRSIVEVTCFGK